MFLEIVHIKFSLINIYISLYNNYCTYYNTNTRTCCYNNAVVSSEQPSACCNYSNFTTAKSAGAVGKSYYNSTTKTCCELKSSDLSAATEPAACTN